MTTKYDGQLEIDAERGVIYFHSKETGWTLLRICQLPTPIPVPHQPAVTTNQFPPPPQLLDVTFGRGVSWEDLLPVERRLETRVQAIRYATGLRELANDVKTTSMLLEAMTYDVSQTLRDMAKVDAKLMAAAKRVWEEAGKLSRGDGRIKR
jgi:hypothetical protein